MSTTPITALIAEDLAPAREDLMELLHAYCNQVEIIAWTDSADSILPMVRKMQPQLLFLDLSLGGKQALDILHPAQLPGLSIIVTTGQQQVDKKLVRPETIAFLNKPIDPVELVAAVQKVQSIQASSTPQVLNRIKVSNKDGTHLIPISELNWLEADGNKTLLHLSTSSRAIPTSKTLKSFEFLIDSGPFCRIHNSYLINLEQVSNFQTADGGWVTLSDGAHLSISRQRLPEFLERVNQNVFSV